MLTEEDIDLFYKLHPAVLQYVNESLKIFPEIKSAGELKNSGIEKVGQVHEELWKNNIQFIDEFVAKNPAGFSKEECSIILSWKKAIHGNFFILKHLKKCSVFLTAEDPTKAYGVCSLMTPLEEMFVRLPIYTEATLIPFRGHIIYDGILRPHIRVMFGSGYCRSFNENYKEAKKNFGLIKTIE